ncbi:hypothetical protein [Fontibacillus sp. BL9]|uniref:hypothetical protein n=1 Tax=Fontibacillus sp. BL9 TaxID=3389971 RepID=UPI0039780BF0
MRWIGRLAKLVITVVIVCMLTVMTTGYVVNTYIQSLLGSYNLPLAAEAPTLGGMMKGMLGIGGSKEKDKNNKNAAGEDKDSQYADTGKESDETGGLTGLGGSEGKGENTSGELGDTSGTNSNGSNNSTGGTGSDTDGSKTGKSGENDGNPGSGGTGGSGGSTDGEAPPEDALPVMGGISGGSGSAGGSQGALGQDEQVVVTPDEMVAKKDGLSDKDKEEVFAMLMAKLPQEEMQKMTEAMEGGLTEAEMIEIEQIIAKYLDKTEYTKMMQILNG